jgi:hypothetical protein
MQSIVNVVTPASSYDLTDLATVKAELKITDGTQDTQLSAWITQASGEIASYCNRKFLKETIKQTFRVLFVRGLQRERFEQIVLARSPVSAISSVVMDSNTLDTTDYEYDDEGILYRVDSGHNVRWFFERLEVTFDAGYDFAKLPAPLGRACISLVTMLRSNSARDPLVKQESVPGVGEVQYWVGGIPGTVGNLPPDIQAMLDPYRSVSV